MKGLLENKVADFLRLKDICLIGFMGAGKTFVGKQLARELDLPLLDTDSLIEAKAQMTIAEIFKTMGEKKFRSIEKSVLEDIVYGGMRSSECGVRNEECRVLCTGGGLPIPLPNRRLLKLLNSFNICLNPPFEVIYERIRGTKRPLVYRRSRKYIFNLWASRYIQYQKIAHITISAVTLDDVMKTLNERVRIMSNE